MKYPLKHLQEARNILAACAMATFSVFGSAMAQLESSGPFRQGEILQYKVKWSFIRLGTVTIRQRSIDSLHPATILMEMRVQSAAGLPFVNVNFVNTSVISQDDPSLRWETIWSNVDSSRTDCYRTSSGTVVMVDTVRGIHKRTDSLTVERPCYDALGLFMIARMLSIMGDSVSLATLNDYKLATTDIVSSTCLEELEVDALCEPVLSRVVEGTAHWEGVSFAGMNGKFKAWFSNDFASVPLRAEVRIVLGSIVLELESYDRSGWGCVHLAHSGAWGNHEAGRP